MTANRLRQLSGEQRANLERRLLECRSRLQKRGSDEIPRRGVRGPCALSFAQQRLWFLDQLEPNSPLYNIHKILRLRGTLDVAALGQALDALVARHEVLRIVFSDVEGTAQQVVCPQTQLTLEADPVREEEIAERVSTLLDQPFDLKIWPLFRITLLRVSPQEHLMVLVMHHIITDGWSMDVLFRDLGQFYQQLLGGDGPIPATLPVQYTDYAVWQHACFRGDVLETQIAYWREQLANAPLLELPTDHPRPAAQDYTGAQEIVWVPHSLVEGMDRLCRHHGVTRFMVLLGVFQVLLSRLSGQDDFLIGSPVAGRTLRELEGLIGFFVNTLVLRADCAGNPSFSDLLARVKGVALDAYAHQELPFEKLVEELQPRRSVNRNPLFDVMLNFIGEVETSPELPGVCVCSEDPERTMAKFPLTFYFRPCDTGFRLDIVYQTALYDARRAQIMGKQFGHLLEQVTQDPGQRIHEYTLCPPGSESGLPDPRANLDSTPPASVIELFVNVAKQAPGRVAVSSNCGTLSYGELVEQAARVAAQMRSSGVVAGEVVAVQGTGCAGLVVGMLAVMWSGGVLLLIDPALPDRRKAMLMREARARHLLDVGPSSDTAAVGGHRVLMSLEAGTGAIIDPLQYWEGETPAYPGSRDPAYIFFTSGSTGTPRAVRGGHDGLSHFLLWQKRQFDVSPRDRVAQLTSMSFDVILRDVFLPLISGAALCIPGDDARTAVLDWMGRNRITIAHVVPSVVRYWLREERPVAGLERLRWVFFAGEPLTDVLVSAWRQSFPGAGEIANLYGATEATLAKCCYVIPRRVTEGVQPVGRAIPGSQVLVVDVDLRLCGVGEPGQIAIRSPFLSHGYLSAGAEERARFVTNPYTGDAGDRLYLTGDEGRFRADTSLDIIGRMDDQIKIRGVRVEPNEIAATLERHPGVSECAVISRGNTATGIQLVAYVVRSPLQAVSETELRSYLARHLPPAMYPSAFGFMTTLPRLRNGKVDRVGLRGAQVSNTSEAREDVQRPTATQSAVARLWSSVLNRDEVGLHDDFFAIGGHSLIATQLVSRINSELGVQLSLRAIFECPTVATLTHHIERQKEAGTEERMPIRVAERGGKRDH